eukprot:11211653-Lingulodinium_polyedra.AAC.1
MIWPRSGAPCILTIARPPSMGLSCSRCTGPPVVCWSSCRADSDDAMVWPGDLFGHSWVPVAVLADSE